MRLLSFPCLHLSSFLLLFLFLLLVCCLSQSQSWMISHGRHRLWAKHTEYCSVSIEMTPSNQKNTPKECHWSICLSSLDHCRVDLTIILGFFTAIFVGKAHIKNKRRYFLIKNTINIKTNNQRNNKLFSQRKQLGKKSSWKRPCASQVSPERRLWTRYNNLASFQSFPYRKHITWSC